MNVKQQFMRLMSLAGLMLLSSCKHEATPVASAASRQAVPVTVAAVVREDVPEQIRTIGNVEAMAVITIKPQVDGHLIKANFTEGQEVKAGDLLLEIDPRPYQAALAEAEATLARNAIVAEDAERAAQQMAEALRGKAMSQREADKARAGANAARAQVQSDAALVDAAKLKLEYCSIHAPIDGRAGALMAKPGNVVEANQTELVQINQVDPIYVSFAMPEQHLAPIRANQTHGPLTVDVIIPGDSGEPVLGELTFIDNRVDMSTGTIRLKATFANQERRLWPGQFVNVILTVATQRNALLTPASAVQSGQKGQYVFVAKADNTVEQRSVSVGSTVGDRTVILQGLTEGEIVVTDGQLRLVPGAAIQVNTNAPPAERTSA